MADQAITKKLIAHMRQKKTMIAYSHLLEEIKARLSSIELAINGKLGVPESHAREFCYLQLRMIAELIALGCLIVHGDIDGADSKALRKEWSAEKILVRLESLHADFYPYAVRQEMPPPGADHDFHIQPVKSGYLSKDDLLRLYRRCGSVLHRGSMKKVTSDKPKEAGYQDIIAWGQRIDRLLGFHYIALFDPDVKYLCVLRDPRHKGAAMMYVARAAD